MTTENFNQKISDPHLLRKRGREVFLPILEAQATLVRKGVFLKMRERIDMRGFKNVSDRIREK